MKEALVSSITDRPIETLIEDRLNAGRYAQALAEFIASGDTPLTIGLQGEWGTGKTSMMFMLRERLREMSVATSWVNTWEYAMFRNARETTPAVLKGMMEALEETCREEGYWNIGEEAQELVRKAGRFFAAIANQIVTRQTGADLAKAAEAGAATGDSRSTIAEIKRDIRTIIEKLIDANNPYERVVFFVDDLDRIPPGDAVEVLEALKNLFDVPKCVYVLAIDYEVVVKGLENKFGPKTEENEREFRSFFDKIIQVPFTMPTGTYAIPELLKDRLEAVGIPLPDRLADDYAKVVSNTVGFNPRSLKRYLNSFSLLRRLRSLEAAADGTSLALEDDLTLFALLGLQISYPKIFNLLVKEPTFLEWDQVFAHRIGVDLQAVRIELDSHGGPEDERTDEEWEQIIYGFCQKRGDRGVQDRYLASRWGAVVDLFNQIRRLWGAEESNEKAEMALTDALGRSLSFASITSIDDDPAARGSGAKQRTVRRFDTIEGKIDSMRETSSFNEGALPLWRKMAEIITESSESGCGLRFTGSYVRLTRPDGRERIVDLHNCGGRKRKVSAYISCQKQPTAGKDASIEILPKTAEDSYFKVNVFSDEGAARFAELVQEALLAPGQL